MNGTITQLVNRKEVISQASACLITHNYKIEYKIFFFVSLSNS